MGDAMQTFANTYHPYTQHDILYTPGSSD